MVLAEAWKDAESIGLGEILDDFFIFREGEVGISAVSGIDHDLEEFLFDLLVDAVDHLGRFGGVGEILKFNPAEEFQVPGFDGAFIEGRLFVATGMKLDHLLDCIVKGFTLELFAGEPLLKRGGGHMFDFVLPGHGEAGVEHTHHRIFILGVEGVGTADHHDQVDLKLESRFKSLKHILEVLGCRCRGRG